LFFASFSPKKFAIGFKWVTFFKVAIVEKKEKKKGKKVL